MDKSSTFSSKLYREGHPSDDNREVVVSLISGVTKHKASWSVLDHFSFINNAEMVAMGSKLWQHILKLVIQNSAKCL